MNVTRVEINNYRSIGCQVIDFKEVADKQCMILLGRNESGKSNALKAISMLNKEQHDAIEYSSDCYKEAEKNGECIEIIFYLDLKNFPWYKDQFVKDGLPEKVASVIKPSYIYRSAVVYKDNSKERSVSIDLPDHKVFSQFLINGEQVKAIEEVYSGEEELTKENIAQLAEGWNFLTAQSLKELLEAKYFDFIDQRIPRVIYWEYDEKYLIDKPVDLNQFKDNQAVCIPLRNIFNICSIEDIKSRIQLIESDKGKRKQLEEELSDGITQYINTVWKEHPINVKVDIESMQCEIMIEDKDNTAPKYSMNQRSDGFKQFVSILLNLSAENNTEKLKNKIVLLDEPEVHLHPSGVRFLRDELLNIAKNNAVVVATHSVFMIDKKSIDRHIAVVKENGQTILEPISSKNPYKDEVLYESLGTSIFELIEENMVVFEGKTDRDLFNAFTSKYKRDIKPVNHGTISADGVEKVIKYTKFLNKKMVAGFIVVDSDGPGRAQKTMILEEEGFTAKNTFEIGDLVKVQEGATLEDLIPHEVLKECLQANWSDISIEIDTKKPFMKQIEEKNRSLKGRLNPDEVKESITKYVLADITKLNKTDCRNKYTLYLSFVEAIHQKMR